MYRSSPFRSTLNTGYITCLGMCKVCTEAVHSVALCPAKKAQTPKHGPGKKHRNRARGVFQGRRTSRSAGRIMYIIYTDMYSIQIITMYLCRVKIWWSLFSTCDCNNHPMAGIPPSYRQSHHHHYRSPSDAKEFWTEIQDSTGWWLNQPLWKICSSNWKSSPNRGEHKTCFKSPPSSRFTPLTINGWNLKTHPMNPRHGLDTG